MTEKGKQKQTDGGASEEKRGRCFCGGKRSGHIAPPTELRSRDSTTEQQRIEYTGRFDISFILARAILGFSWARQIPTTGLASLCGNTDDTCLLSIY